MTLDDGRRIFVKHHHDAPPGSFPAEADGLAWIAEAGALRTPAVLAVGDGGDTPFLALEWIDRERGAAGRGEEFGRALAALHAVGAESFGARPGNWIGPLPQPNEPCPTWAEFYAERRLAPLARRAVDARLMDAAFPDVIERLGARMADLAGPPEPPARLHGDLWSGNAILDAVGGPVVLDPAAYGGHREVDLAMMRLFGGFPPAVHAAYAEAARSPRATRSGSGCGSSTRYSSTSASSAAATPPRPGTSPPGTSERLSGAEVQEAHPVPQGAEERGHRTIP